MEKKYLALVCGEPEKKSGVINYSLGRLIKNPTKIGVGSLRQSESEARKNIKNEREASTYYEKIKSCGDKFSLIAAYPKTGRMHQIRVHLKSIGCPVACDKVYGGKNVCCPSGLNRIFLHAESLSFSYPEGKRWIFEADLPEDLVRALATCEK